MSKRNDNNTKGKIINAAWDLFYEQGYEYTTVEEIIEYKKTLNKRNTFTVSTERLRLNICKNIT